MLNAIIIDDEPLAHEIILNYCQEMDDVTIIEQCYSATEALKIIPNVTVDILFVDIHMPILNGIEFIGLLESKPHIIITSAYQEYALEGFNLNVTDYLLKPFRFDRFLQAINKIKSPNNLSTSSNSSQNAEPTVDSLYIKVDKKQVKITLSDVSHFEAYGNYVKVWRNSNSSLTPRTLTSFEQNLPTVSFIRIHKSIIVNTAYIDYIEHDKLYLLSGTALSIGKQFKQNLKI